MTETEKNIDLIETMHMHVISLLSDIHEHQAIAQNISKNAANLNLNKDLLQPIENLIHLYQDHLDQFREQLLN